jgi:hypothetical protein
MTLTLIRQGPDILEAYRQTRQNDDSVLKKVASGGNLDAANAPIWRASG